MSTMLQIDTSPSDNSEMGLKVREASIPVEGDAISASTDDTFAIVLTTKQLTCVPNLTSAFLDRLVDGLVTTSNWVEQYESLVMLRRIVVHHGAFFNAKHIEQLVRPLALECDSLRSTASKNGLVACAEIFEFLPPSVLERPLLGGAHAELLDVLFRRSVCEKRFLRDAATIAIEKLATNVAGLPLLLAASRYSGNKNPKLCASAAKLIALSLKCFPNDRADKFRDGMTLQGNESLKLIYRALAAFRQSKDRNARAEATTSLQLLDEILGAQPLELGFRGALPDVRHILRDRTCPKIGTLRNRMMQQHINGQRGIKIV